MIDWTYSPNRSLPAKIKRRATQWRMAAPAIASDKEFIVSFTFDDFPKSATHGADIIETFGGKAGFYACTSMIEKNGPYGEMFDTNTLLDLHDRGHEIGAHTHSHLDCAQATTQDVIADIDRNLTSLVSLGLKTRPTSLAYPFGETTFTTKAKTADMFDICRGILPGINVGKVDRAQLRCYELNGNSTTPERATNAIKTASQTGGWVMIFTHDVSKDSTGFGTSPAIIMQLCQLACDLGAKLLSPTAAARECGVI